MKHAFCITALILLLAGCGERAPEPGSVADEPVVESPVEETVDAVVESPADIGDEIQEAVEESAAEPETDEETIMLAQAEPPAAQREWQFTEGQHYQRMVPTQPTVGGADKIEVAEFFWYGCPHCFDFEPFINGWAEKMPANVRFVRVPAMWNRILKLHAQLFYAGEVLIRNGVIKDGAEFHAAVFQEYHRRGNRLMTEDAIRKIFERFGVSADEFSKTWNSFEVAQKLRVAEDLARRYSIANVPTVVVNGKYRTGGAEAVSYPKLLEVIDELIARESLR